MENKQSQTIKGDNNEQNITIHNYYGIQRDEVEQMIKEYCSVDKQVIIDLIKEVIGSINPDNAKMPDKRTFIPLIQQLSYSLDDDYLKETFKNLLKSTMRKDKNVHPSFVTILGQLNSDEIKILNALPPITIHYHPLLNVRVKTGEQSGDGFLLVRYFSDICYKVCEFPSKSCLYLENLERLKLIDIPPFRSLVDKSKYEKLKNHPAVLNATKIGSGQIPGVSIEYYELCFCLTQFGLDFIKACTS